METYISAALITKLFKALNQIKSERSAELDAISREFTDAKALAKYYVEPNCQNRNPADSSDDMEALDIRMPIFRHLNQFFNTESPVVDGRNHMILLADAGMGKTSLLVILKLLDLMSFFPKRNKCVLLKLGEDTLSRIGKIKSPKSTILLLDALDEDPEGVGNILGRFHDIISKTENFKKVIISCRTQYLPEGGYSPFDQVGRLVIKGYTCRSVFLSLFDDEQVDIYLKKRFPRSPEKREKGLQIVKKMDSLKFRPLLLSYIEDFFDLEEEKWTEYRIYEELILAWLRREERKVRGNLGIKIDHQEILDVCLELAQLLQKQVDTSLIPEDLIRLIKEKPNFKLLTQLDVGGRSLLNKNSDGAYRFSHYTIQEFLIAYSIVNKKVEDVELIRATDKILDFLSPFDWSEIQIESLDFDKTEIRNRKIKSVNFDEGSFDKAKFIRATISNSNFINCRFHEAKINHSELSQTSFESSNLSELNSTNSSFISCSFNSVKSKNLKLKDCSFTGCNFQEADLRNGEILKCEFVACNFAFALLDYADLGDSVFIDCTFTSASTHVLKTERTFFKGLSRDTINLESSDFTNAEFED